jgi:hypothetical protein
MRIEHGERTYTGLDKSTGYAQVVGQVTFAQAEKIADAVLNERYALGPSGATPGKHQIRYQRGILMPPGYLAVDPSERTFTQTECVTDRAQMATLRVRVRFLHLTQRTLFARGDEGTWLPVDELDLGSEIIRRWDEASYVQVDIETKISALVEGVVSHHFGALDAFSTQEVSTAEGRSGLVEREARTVRGVVELRADPFEGPHGVMRLMARVRNTTEPLNVVTDRDEALRHALVSCHVLLSLDKGKFISRTAPPEFARGYVSLCENEGTYPVLVDESAKTVLSSPIALSDVLVSSKR